MGYQAWFQCQKGCDERYSLYEVVYRCKKMRLAPGSGPRYGGAARPLGATVEGPLRRALHADELSLWQRHLGQDGVGLPDNRARKRHLHV